jgi:hypothetical protein
MSSESTNPTERLTAFLADHAEYHNRWTYCKVADGVVTFFRKDADNRKDDPTTCSMTCAEAAEAVAATSTNDAWGVRWPDTSNAACYGEVKQKLAKCGHNLPARGKTATDATPTPVRASKGKSVPVMDYGKLVAALAAHKAEIARIETVLATAKGDIEARLEATEAASDAAVANVKSIEAALATNPTDMVKALLDSALTAAKLADANADADRKNAIEAWAALNSMTLEDVVAGVKEEVAAAA